MNERRLKGSKFALPLAVFGFLLIIATGSSMLFTQGQIPLFVAIIGLVLLVIAIFLRKREVMEN
jgi:hypothetical protein